MKTLMFERDTANNKILALEEKIKSRECEQQASRQTITRLAAQLSSADQGTTANEEKINLLQKVIYNAYFVTVLNEPTIS